jgi:hypothetical protein
MSLSKRGCQRSKRKAGTQPVHMASFVGRAFMVWPENFRVGREAGDRKMKSLQQLHTCWFG